MAPVVAPSPRFDTRLAVFSLILSLIPVCLTQFVAFYLATRVIKRSRDNLEATEQRGLAMAAQTCSVFMIPVTGIVGIALAVLLVPWMQKQQSQKQEEEVILALRQIHVAQTAWHQRDPDRNGVKDYSVDSLRALYETRDEKGAAIALIPEVIALADAGAMGMPGARSYLGYDFHMLSHDQEGIPYRSRAASAFGIAARPTGKSVYPRMVFIVNENGIVYQKEYAGADVAEWPATDPTTKGWRPVR